MRVVQGTCVRQMESAELLDWVRSHRAVTVDLGTGDGRYVRELARRATDEAVIGVDLCAANLRTASRGAGGNTLFVVADALALPDELESVATRVTVNFPWGSLLRGFVEEGPALHDSLRGLVAEPAGLEIRLNAGALADVGWSLEAGIQQVGSVLDVISARVGDPVMLSRDELRRWPSTWAKRLAFGRDPRAVEIRAILF